MANEISRPAAGPLERVIQGLESVLNNRQLTVLKNVVFILVLLNYWSYFYAKIAVCGPLRVAKDFQAFVKRIIFKQLRRLPSVQAKINAELDKTLKEMEHSMMSREGDNVVPQLRLPKHGLTEEQVLDELKTFQKMRGKDWEGGRVSGAVYHGGEELTNLLAEAYRMYAVSNPLHPEVFPGVRRMEADSVAMVLNMYNAPSTGCGTMTSGGTESIIMACKAYRDMYKDLRGIDYPEMVVPETIHAAFMKASGYFNIKLIMIPVDPITCQVDVKKMAKAITRNTIMIAGSAVNFPHGIADDITALGKLAKKHGIGLHVDCCLGSFIVPFLEKAGLPSVPFDFRVDGVTSISCDTHKYGFAPKGSSIVMYREKKIRKYQYFVCSEWTGGIYASPSIAGSRPGALIAGCWAALMRIGEDGYLDACKKIVGARQIIENTVRSIPQLTVKGNPISSVIAFGAKEPLNIYDVGDMLGELGWDVSALQNPPALHISVTLPWVPSAADFAKDLREVVNQLVSDPSKGKGSTAAIYGTAASIPDKSIIDDVAAGFIDLLYKS
ncbi:sphingosine-1-phosphate lyase [Dichotomocladium elegans]|nr:sphingosine-1-phosphate lyase [Dichotomocladium elegans]